MELILWRHAEAEEGFNDAERKLTAAGVKQAERMAAWLHRRLPADILVLASPARRAQQTAAAFCGKFRSAEEVGVGTDAKTLLAAVEWPQHDGTVVVVGHQPTLGQAAALALTGKIADWNLKQGAIVWLGWRERGDGLHVRLRAALSPDLI